MSYLGIVLTFVFVNNLVLVQLLGLCPIVGVAKQVRSTIGLGASIASVSTVSSLVAWILDRLLLEPLGVGFLQIVVIVVAAAGTARGLDWVISRTSKLLYASVGVFLPVVTANCAVVGIALIAVRSQYGPLQSLVAGASGGLGAMMAMVLLATLREKLDSEWVPAPLRGMPITLITAGLIALAFLAFDKAFVTRLIG